MSGTKYISLEQDGKGKNGKSTTHIPYERNKHLVKPYYGDSQVTDGRGVKRSKNNREDFLAYAFGIDLAEVPTQIDIAVAVVADREMFAEASKQIEICYDNGKRVGLLDIVPAAYYSDSGEVHQFGSNPTKAEPVLKVTRSVSVARDLALDKHGNKVIGLLVTSDIPLAHCEAELDDLLRRKTLRFAHITSQLKAEVGERILTLYENASLFACTKEYLERNCGRQCKHNPLTDEMYRRLGIIAENSVSGMRVDGGWSWEDYRGLKNALVSVRQSNIQFDEKEEFIISAHGLINLLNTAVFSMRNMEDAIATGIINQTVSSPKTRIDRFWAIADRAGVMQDLLMSIIVSIENRYTAVFESSPKAQMLNMYLSERSNAVIAVIVPKAYYADILRFSHPEYFSDERLICVTANRFNQRSYYDHVLVVGNVNNERFDPLYCMAAKSIDVLLYGCEHKMFGLRQRKRKKYDRRLNFRIGASVETDSDDGEDLAAETELEAEIKTISDFDDYINSLNTFDIRRFVSSGTAASVYSSTSEVSFVGAFVTGEQIFFSKFYEAVVYDSISGAVEEKKADKLTAGDVLVFVKRDDYTRSIVDYIYEKLIRSRKLGADSVDNYEKSVYWKEALREYKEKNGYTYRKVAQKLRALGSSLQEVTVRQWLVEDSHIVGPRDEKTLHYIAELTQDQFLLSDTHAYDEACRAVRHERRTILDWIGKAINEKLRGHIPAEDSVLKIVFDNIDNLAETMELANIWQLDTVANINVNLVNRPITESEVLM